MALRVLLGDESSTIKKVFQLALQDFAVEVRPVNIGVDVASVAQAFKPDIIFVDVLLTKKNGYDVSSELKQHQQLKDIPVVLMWSGFMELDQDKFQASMANGQLEKPFDVSALRKLVTELVPRTNSQRLSQFLTFPKMPEIEDASMPPEAPQTASSELHEEEDFKQVSLPNMKKTGDEKFRLNISPEDLDPDSVPVDYNVPGEKAEEPDQFSVAPPPSRSVYHKAADLAPADLEMEDLVEVPLEEDRPSNSVAAVQPAPISSASSLSAEQLEKIIREQSAEVIESVVWKVVPELAKQIIERELNRLLKERDSHPY
jgi:two-component system, cell cycle response regulator